MEKFRNITRNISSADWWQKKIEKSVIGKDERTTFASRYVLDRLKDRKTQVIPETLDDKERVFKFGAWDLKITENSYEFSSTDEATGNKKFYSLESGPKYGEPFIVAEPDLAIKVPENLKYADVNGKEIVVPTAKISGIICQDFMRDEAGAPTKDLEVRHRFSWTNKGERVIEYTEDGLIINGERWYFKTLFAKDDNRIRNYDAYLSKEKPTEVKLIELKDLYFVESAEFVEDKFDWKELVIKDKSDVKRLAKKVVGAARRLLGFSEKTNTDKKRKPDFERTIGQWTVRVWHSKDGAGEDYEIVRLDGDVRIDQAARETFYKVIKGPYQNPLIVPEPELSFAVPNFDDVVYRKPEQPVEKQVVNEVPMEKISGIICQDFMRDEDGNPTTELEVKHRFSLSNNAAPKFRLTKDGLIIFTTDKKTGKPVKERWYLNVLFKKDKNRIVNSFDGFYTRQKPATVRIIELEELKF